jgi:hypothetical protein
MFKCVNDFKKATEKLPLPAKHMAHNSILKDKFHETSLEARILD